MPMAVINFQTWRIIEEVKYCFNSEGNTLEVKTSLKQYLTLLNNYYR